MANTRITQGVIKPNEDYDVRHINATGIITAQNLNLTGVLTYEDVTNVDSIGVITARKGIVSSGVVTATAFHGDGSALTGIDATALKDPAGNVKIQAQTSGAMHTGFSTMQNLRVTGIATFGSGSTTIDNNVINVGTALTLGHTQGLQFHTQNLHSVGFEINNINASGIITASKFVGDGADLLNLPAGLGTALSSVQTNPLNKIYYTNSVLPIESTVTVDPPASASAAYTQYTDISVADGADLIISDGDDLIPDVLGLRPDGTFGGGALGRMRVDKLVGKDANSAVNVEKGLVISGVTTAETFNVTGNLSIGGTITYDDVTNIDSIGIITARTQLNVGNNIKLGNAGVITATSFSGSGANLTSLPAAQLSGALPALDGSALTGIVGGKFNGPAAGILTTSTVGIQTADVTSANLVGAATSMVGLYIGDGHLLFSNYLNKSGGYYITTGLNALNAGPVTLGTPMTLDGTWTIV